MSSSITLSFVALSFSLDWLTRELLGSASLHLPMLGLEACAARFRFYVDVGDSDSVSLPSQKVCLSSDLAPQSPIKHFQVYKHIMKDFVGNVHKKDFKDQKKKNTMHFIKWILSLMFR